ncbi:hypothetical protein K438DRAFT_1948084 [Mycena galopus ATCC 62051]|nr:hypothetical protein K438DRAFT_1948084 [Mycena galopus ATCC 62051]
MPVAPRLPPLLIPVPTRMAAGSSSTQMSTGTPSTGADTQSNSSRTSMQAMTTTSPSSASQSGPSTPTSPSLVGQSGPSTPNGPSSAGQPPSTPTTSVPTVTAADALRARDAVRAAYAIAMPSPVRKTASRSALAAENEQLRSLLNAAGVALDNNYAQMALENGNLRQQLHAKKNKPKRTYTTGKARLMTSAEMHQALLEDLQKKQMGELHSEMRKTWFPTIRKEIGEAENVAKAKKKKLEQERKTVAKAAEKAKKTVAKAAEKAKKAAAKEVAKAAAKALGRGRGGVGGRRGRGGSRRGRGGGRGGRKSQDSGDDEDEELSPESESSEENADVVDPNPVASATNDESDEESDFDEPSASGNSGLITANTLPSIQEDSDDDDESDQEETGIVSFNGHRWESRRNLEFQVVWADGDMTWELLSNVNDCAAMEDYLAHRDIDDPLLLSKQSPSTVSKAVDNERMVNIIQCSGYFFPNAEPGPQVRFTDSLNLDLNLAFGFKAFGSAFDQVRTLNRTCFAKQRGLTVQKTDEESDGRTFMGRENRGKRMKEAEVEAAGMGGLSMS